MTTSSLPHEPLVSTLPGLISEGRYLEPGAAEEIVIGSVLALVVDGLPAQQPDLTEQKKGPKYGAPAKACAPCSFSGEPGGNP